ncbi:hypothetical protein SLS60_005409 [Paraconiothyrium brasiliense]|uniref:C3H1-type domain-containing protein n=1 Tax=Paraconiothyrium brasiliense TaxID=300254 RepID=A0ABR3RH96_9PLEO
MTPSTQSKLNDKRAALAKVTTVLPKMHRGFAALTPANRALVPLLEAREALLTEEISALEAELAADKAADDKKAAADAAADKERADQQRRKDYFDDIHEGTLAESRLMRGSFEIGQPSVTGFTPQYLNTVAPDTTNVTYVTPAHAFRGFRDKRPRDEKIRAFIYDAQILRLDKLRVPYPKTWQDFSNAYHFDGLDYESQGRGSNVNEHLKGSVDVARMGGTAKHNPYKCYRDFLDKGGCAFAAKCRYSHEDYTWAEMLYMWTSGHADHLTKVEQVYAQRYPKKRERFGKFKGIPLAPLTPPSDEEIDAAVDRRDKRLSKLTIPKDEKSFYRLSNTNSWAPGAPSYANTAGRGRGRGAGADNAPTQGQGRGRGRGATWGSGAPVPPGGIDWVMDLSADLSRFRRE